MTTINKQCILFIKALFIFSTSTFKIILVLAACQIQFSNILLTQQEYLNFFEKKIIHFNACKHYIEVYIRQKHKLNFIFFTVQT